MRTVGPTLGTNRWQRGALRGTVCHCRRCPAMRLLVLERVDPELKACGSVTGPEDLDASHDAGTLRRAGMLTVCPVDAERRVWGDITV